MGSTGELDSEGERDREKEEKRKRKRERSRSKDKDKERERSRSKGRDRSKDREKKKHKKHKKEKKKHKKRERSSEGDDTANEGGDTPEAKTPTGRDKDGEKTPDLPDIEKLPGLGKYDSDGEGEEGEIEEKKLEIERERRKEHNRDEEKKERKEYQREEKGSGREKRENSRDRDRKRRSRSRERKRSVERGRDRDRNGRENAFRSDKENKERENRDREGRDRHKREERGENKEEPGELTGGKEVMSLSIEETNKLRAKLGLKPLNVSTIVVEDETPDLPGELIPGDRDKTRHLVPQHWGERDQQKKLREKLGLKKEQRQVKSKLAVVKGLGESDSEDDDAGKWVERQKKKVKEKEEADKRAKAMAELDEEFGVQDIVEEGLKMKQQEEYTSRDLKGMRVEHKAEAFGEKDTVLTLQDADILSDKYEDVLVNVNIVDDERHAKSLANIKAGKEGYQAYDQEEVDELTGEVRRKELLYQYQEELDGAKKDSFTLEGEGEFSESVSRERELAKIRQKLRQNNAVSLEMPAPKIATDFYTDAEMLAFKKPKKKKKVRKKMLKADDLLAMTQESSLLPTGFGEKQKKRAIRIVDDDQILPDGRLPNPDEDHDDLPVVPDLSGVKVDKDDDDGRAMRALKIARKLTKVKTVDNVAEEVLRDSRENTVEMDDEGGDKAHYSDLVIDQTQEFCRGLGEVGSYEPSGLGEGVDKELLDFEKSLESERMRSAVEWSKMEEREEKVKKKEETRSKRGTWEEVDEEVVEEGRWKEGARRQQRRGGSSTSNNTGGGKAPYRPAILEDEALAATGMGAALKMALQKGYLDTEEKKVKSTGLVHLKCKNYNIDDKSRDHEEDDRKRRGGARDRGYQGPTSSFSEKKGYKPEVTLEYVDDTGRAMNAKEAFRFLSHKFHGKGSGKLKTEKRQRKVLEDKLMEKMSSTDTPLNTLTKLQNKTKELATPYLVLSGNKHSMGGHTSLKK